jgi:hypothetical protein
MIFTIKKSANILQIIIKLLPNLMQTSNKKSINLLKIFIDFFDKFNADFLEIKSEFLTIYRRIKLLSQNV